MAFYQQDQKYFNILTVGFALIGYVGCIKALNFPQGNSSTSTTEHMRGIFKQSWFTIKQKMDEKICGRFI